MQELSSIRKDFDALCEQYGLPKDEMSEALFGIFLSRGVLMPSSTYEGQSVFEIARMLKQLSGVGIAGFTLQNVGGVTRNTYSSPELVEVLKKSLVDALKARVRKIEDAWVTPDYIRFRDSPEDKMVNVRASMAVILQTISGGEEREVYQEERLVYIYPEGVHPSQDSFSEQELEAIINYGERLAEWEKKMMGNKERWMKDGASRLPELGKLAEIIIRRLPVGWTMADKLNFVAGYLYRGGYLDFKDAVWLNEFEKMGRKKKDRMVRNWINSYQQSQKDK